MSCGSAAALSSRAARAAAWRSLVAPSASGPGWCTWPVHTAPAPALALHGSERCLRAQVHAISMFTGARRALSTSASVRSHENPLGLPRNNARAPPTIPRRSTGGPPQKRRIPHVKKVIVVSSGKGGVGKSTIAANLAVALSLTRTSGGAGASPGSTSRPRRRRVGLLDLDVFGPSVPKLMGLQNAGEPALTQAGALLPLYSHGVACMSMGFLLPPSKPLSDPTQVQGQAEEAEVQEAEEPEGNEDTPVVWRGMMVMKAVQQLLFDVDWRRSASASTSPSSSSGPSDSGLSSSSPAENFDDDALDVLVIDMPPGTGDVALSLSQLVRVDAALVVSTPQEVALLDARKGVALFRKTDVPIAGLVLNMSHFVSPESGRSYPIFGSSRAFDALAARLRVPVLGRVPLEPALAAAGDAGQPAALRIALLRQESRNESQEGKGEGDAHAAPGEQSAQVFASIAHQLVH